MQTIRENRTMKPTKSTDAISEDDDDPVPKDMEEFRRELCRRIHTFLGHWRQCCLPLCKRHRACRATEWLACQRHRPPSTPEQLARAAAKFRVALDEKLQMTECEAEAAATVHPSGANARALTRRRKPGRGRK
jgi:hypothetical protein